MSDESILRTKMKLVSERRRTRLENKTDLGLLKQANTSVQRSGPCTVFMNMSDNGAVKSVDRGIKHL